MLVRCLSRAFISVLAGADPRRIVVFTGDRRDIQQSAIESGIRLLVVTGGLPIDDDLVALARERGVSVLCTAFDTATSALLARMSTPVHLPGVMQISPERIGMIASMKFAKC